MNMYDAPFRPIHMLIIVTGNTLSPSYPGERGGGGEAIPKWGHNIVGYIDRPDNISYIGLGVRRTPGPRIQCPAGQFLGGPVTPGHKALESHHNSKGDVTWISPNWYQTHQLINDVSGNYCTTIPCGDDA